MDEVWIITNKSMCVQLYDSEGVTILFEKMEWLQAANLKIAECMTT